MMPLPRHAEDYAAYCRNAAIRAAMICALLFYAMAPAASCQAIMPICCRARVILRCCDFAAAAEALSYVCLYDARLL